jgi:hypothetical protein
LAFVYDGLFKENIRSDVSSARKRITLAVGICEITTINEEITAFTQGMVQQVMITVPKRVVLVWAKGEKDGGSLSTQALQKNEAFAL